MMLAKVIKLRWSTLSDDRKWRLYYYSTGFIYDHHLWSSKYFIVQATGPLFTTLYFHRNLQVRPISWSVCSWQDFPDWYNVSLWPIWSICKLWRKWSVVNMTPNECHLTEWQLAGWQLAFKMLSLKTQSVVSHSGMTGIRTNLCRMSQSRLSHTKMTMLVWQ